MDQYREKTLRELRDQALDLRAVLVGEWDIETHIELTTRLFVLENQTEKEALDASSSQA
jgi:hypothetical protein